MTAPTGSSPEATPTIATHAVIRGAVFLGAAALAIMALQLATAMALRSRPGELPPLAWSVSMLALGLLIGHAAVIHRYHGGLWSYVGLDLAAWRAGTLIRAAVLAVCAIGVPSLFLLGIGELRFEPASGAWWDGALGLLAILVPAALWEELSMRGYLLSILRERFGTVVALVATSLVFGALHLQNEGATALSTAAVTLAGIFLGLVRLRTGSLAAAWAAHLAWNLTMSVVLRTPVSGIDLTMGGYRMVDAGPDWITGGAWGPEGGVAAMLGMAVASWYLMRRMRRKEFST